VPNQPQPQQQVLKGQIDEIDKVDVETYDVAVTAAADTRDKWNPSNRETADHSIPYVLAVVLTNGSLWLDDFTEERIRNAQVHTLMQKIEVHKNEEYSKDYPEANPFRIEVVTRSGERHTREIRYAKGHPKNPMTDHEIEAKFHRLAQPLLTPRRIDQILDRLWHLQEVQSLEKMLTLFEV